VQSSRQILPGVSSFRIEASAVPYGRQPFFSSTMEFTSGRRPPMSWTVIDPLVDWPTECSMNSGSPVISCVKSRDTQWVVDTRSSTFALLTPVVPIWCPARSARGLAGLWYIPKAVPSIRAATATRILSSESEVLDSWLVE